MNCKQEYLIIFNGTSHGIFLISFTNVHTPFHFEQQRKRVWSIIYTAMQYKWTIFKKDLKNPIFQVQFRLCTYVCNISANKGLESQTIDFSPMLFQHFFKMKFHSFIYNSQNHQPFIFLFKYWQYLSLYQRPFYIKYSYWLRWKERIKIGLMFIYCPRNIDNRKICGAFTLAEIFLRYCTMLF